MLCGVALQVFLFQGGQVGKIAIHVFVVEPVTNDEFVGNLESDKVGLVVDLLSTFLTQAERRS